jgi:hypothetical protein
MTDKTFEIIKIGNFWVLRVFHTDPGHSPICLHWTRIKASEKDDVIQGMRSRGYCYQA